MAERRGYPSEDSAESDDSGSTDSEDFMEDFLERVRKLQEVAEKQDRVRTTFRAQCGLAASVAAWVVIFGLPLNSLSCYQQVFGYRGNVLEEAREDMRSRRYEINADEATFNRTLNKLRISCQPSNTGRMRNVAGPYDEAQLVKWTQDMGPWDSAHHQNDIWCGFLNENYLSYWPNVGQLIIFSVFKSTGTTIELAWQGLVGTFFASLNVVLMQQAFPAGAKGHVCGDKEGYTTIFHRGGMFEWKEASTFQEAMDYYLDDHYQAGLDARAIFVNNGTAVPGYSWSLNWVIWGEMVAKVKEIEDEDCIPGTMVYDDPNYNKWLCLVDVIGVLFLFLISRSATNTIMFGMSWHVCFMMNFMNPHIGAEECHGWACLDNGSVRSAVFKTTLIGAAVSILATLTVAIVLPICNLRNLEEDSLAVTQTVTEIWVNSLKYMNGNRRSAKRFHIATQIANADSIMSGAQEDADGAWWETLDQGPCGSKRLLLKEYDLCTADIRGMLGCLGNCLLSEDFQGQHSYFCEKMMQPMIALEREVYQLMYMIVQACIDGVISDSEAKVIRKVVSEVKQQQKELVSTFRRTLPEISRDLAEEIIFAFTLSFWARKLSDFGEQVAALSTKHAFRKRHLADTTRAFCQGLWSSFRNTWSPRRLFCDTAHVKFAVRNLLSISIVFLIAYLMPSSSVFIQYSTTMPATLSLLVVADGTHQIGSMIYKNIHRLLAVVLGKVLPVMITSALTYFPCLSESRVFFQFSTTWFYLFVFIYIYYASPMWGYVGCLIAGFGVYGLMSPCSRCDDALYKLRYQEIGAVTFAIFLQALVHSLLSYHTPVQLELRALRQLGDDFRAGFKAFFQNDLQAMQAASRQADTHLATAKGLLQECDPKLKVMRCGEKDFKLELCTRVLMLCEQLLDDLNLLITASKDWVPNESIKETSTEKAQDETGPLGILTSRPAMGSVQSDLTSSLESTFELFLATLGSEEVESNRDVEDLRHSKELEAAPELYAQVKSRLDDFGRQGLKEEHSDLTSNLCVRLNVLVRALENAKHHLSLMTEKCLGRASA